MSQVAISGNASGTGTLTIAAPNTNSNRTLSLPDGTGTFTVNGVNSNIVSGTAVASTSGTSIDFTSIPSWVKRITVMFNGVSTSGTSAYLVQIGAGSVTTTGYSGSSSFGATAATYSSGFIVSSAHSASTLQSGIVTLALLGSNTWTQNAIIGLSNASSPTVGGGVLALGGTLDRVRITTSNGTDTFDAGSINILYE